MMQSYPLGILPATEPVHLHLLVTRVIQVFPPLVAGVVTKLVAAAIMGDVVGDCLPGNTVSTLGELRHGLL